MSNSSDETPSPTSPSFSSATTTSATSTSPKIVDISKLEEVKTVVLNDDALLTLKNVAKNATSKENDDALNQETAMPDKKVRFFYLGFLSFQNVVKIVYIDN